MITPLLKRAFAEHRGLSIYLLVILSAGGINLMMGGDPFIVLLVEACVLASTVPSFLYGERDLCAMFTLAVGVLYASSAMIWKTITFAGVDQDLYAPVTSFTVILYGILAMVAAAAIAHRFLPAVPLFKERYSPSGLQLLAVLGAFLMALNLSIIFGGLSLLGGINAISGTGSTMLPVCWIAYNVSRGKPPITRTLAITVLAFSVVALSFNSRQSVLQPFTALACFFLCFKLPVNKKAFIAAVGAAIIFVGVVSPIMLAVRSFRRSVSPADIIALTLNNATSTDGWAKATAVTSLLNKYGNYRLRYVEGGGEFVGRFVEVQPLDILVGYAERFGTIGTSRFWRGVYELLPAAIVPDKTVSVSGSFPLWRYGLVPWGKEWNATLTMFGDAYSVGGMAFVIGSSFTIFLLIFTTLRLFCPRFENSVFATFFFAAYVHGITEAPLLGVLGIPTREFFIELIVFWLATKVTRPIFRLTAPQPALA